jgi:hypothetical protein
VIQIEIKQNEIEKAKSNALLMMEKYFPGRQDVTTADLLEVPAYQHDLRQAKEQVNNAAGKLRKLHSRLSQKVELYSSKFKDDDEASRSE